ncbi:MAG: hypothetical protein LBG73_04990 [Spirochaetaceae bacterium]|jgi:hypothetical protein|nr:hypothetical protein [Spirochaetaceae bacterium]
MNYPFRIGEFGAGVPAFLPAQARMPAWNVPKSDREALKELAKRYAELAAQPVNQERIARLRDMNDLKPVRPPVWIDELPWHELNVTGELTLHCQSEEAKTLEEFFRRILFRWKYFQADMVVEDTLWLIKSYSSNGIGISIKEETIATDTENAVVSHHYEDQLDTDAKVDALTAPAVKAHPEIDRKNLEVLSEILDGALPVALRGHYVDYSPWEHMAEFRGVQQCIDDIIERPELIHKTMKKFADLGTSFFDQCEAEGLLDFNIQKNHCTPAYTSGLPAKDYDGGKVRFKDTWLRTRAQMFVMVSPAMRDEYDLQYIRPFLDRAGYVYYGCCEPLDKCMSYLRQIPNMRKIGASPWANIPSLAEQIGGDYVLARKPNPASVAVGLNEDALKKEIGETVESCIKHKCPYEFVLKDISTAGRKLENLINWVTVVASVIDKQYR